MECVGIESIKKTYRDILQKQGNYEVASQINIKDFTEPLYKGLIIHPEIEPSLKTINESLQKISVDLVALNSQYSSVANFYNDLMTEVLTNLESVDETIEREKERIQDMNIIAGNISSFSTIKTLTASELSGTCSMEDEHTFMCRATDRTSVFINIEDVLGNGYEGNTYVYNDGIYEKDIIDSSVRNKMIDDSSTSYWEYSRITMPECQKHYPSEVNFDNNEAECTILISGEEEFNSLKIQSDINNLSVEQISVSYDEGLTYQDTMVDPIDILNPSQKYENTDYIYGSGLLSFPATTYAKIKLRSNGSLDDNLAFTKVILDNVSFLEDITFDTREYIIEYLAPIFVHARTDLEKFFNMPTSVLIGITLVKTSNKPSNVGLFNFWDLDYNSNLTSLQSDNDKCAFSNHEEACAAIKTFILSNTDIKNLLPKTDPINSSEETCKELASAIFQLISDDYEVSTKIFNNFFAKYDLKKYDGVYAHYIQNPIYEKYEQYFSRHDQQQKNYEEALKDAETVVSLDNARRHVIRINDITAFSNTFELSSYLETTELISSPVDCIAIFANEYYSPAFTSNTSIYDVEDYLSYKLTVNGVEYNVVPINSHKSGIKIVRFSNYTVTENYTVHINEPVKSAKLKVNFVTPNPSYSPYLSNLKICLGKAVSL